jgi:hypothetical protein|tara:strand:+ start:2010 stop:2840 length:831 start_codon:yes stop_codon:yes gene_type:complete
MTFIKGFNIKPKLIDKTGVVTFTDGTNNDIIPNQVQCEAYGYTYDSDAGTCNAFVYSQNLEKNLSNTNNKINGSQNVTELGTNNTFIMGENNIVKGFARNNIIVGSNNEIANSVNNATVLGNYGIAERDGEVVFGGGGFNGAGKGYGQSSVISLSGTTTDATQTNLKVNDSSTNTIIARSSTSSFQGFEANVLGVRTGGSAGSGAVNDRVFFRVTGLVFLKAVDQTSTDLGKFGTTGGWASEVVFSGTNDMHLSVTGAASMNISWSATLNLYEIIV